jgi:hypothetical protein
MWAPVPKILGRRGAALLLSGILWLFVAWGVTLMPIPASRPRAPHEYVPLTWRVTGWAVAGLFAIGAAFLWQRIKDSEGLAVLDRVGFALLVVMPVERMVSWLIVLILHIPWVPDLIPLPAFGNAVAGFAVWLVVCLHLILISGWAEPISAPEVLPLRAI